MLAVAHTGKEKPHNVISIERHACFKKSGPTVEDQDPVDFICHELLKPLTVINHSARLLNEMPLGATEKGLVEKIALSSQTAMQYSRDVQRATRLRRIMLDARDFAPGAMLHDLAMAAGDFAFLNGVELQVAVAGHVPDLMLAPDQKIAQLLAAFLHNAIKRSRGQTVRLSVVGTAGRGMFFAVFKVETHMAALSEDAMERFASFQDAHSHFATLFCGRGLGLASCKGQAARIGARISVTTGAEHAVAVELAIPCKLPVTYAEPLLLV